MKEVSANFFWETPTCRARVCGAAFDVAAGGDGGRHVPEGGALSLCPEKEKTQLPGYKHGDFLYFPVLFPECVAKGSSF